MKYLLSAIMIFSLIACGGGEKRTNNAPPPPPEKYTYVIPTQEMFDKGKTVFYKYCMICHKEGIAGAAALTNTEQWTNNRAKDLNVLVQHVHDGYTGEYGTMTPKGTCMECSKDDLRDAIFYMMNEAGVL
jgi:cytochrome c5